MTEAAWFGGRLRELREEAGLSRKEMADKADLSVSAIRDFEQGIRKPSWETALTIAKALGVECTAFTQPPAEREPAGPGRPPKAKEQVGSKKKLSRGARQRPKLEE